MNENATAAAVRAFDRAYINGQFVTPYGTQLGLEEYLEPKAIISQRTNVL